jgi:hypothetical protein
VAESTPLQNGDFFSTLSHDVKSFDAGSLFVQRPFEAADQR